MPGQETRFAVLFFTDIVDSAELKARHGVPAYAAALRTHNAHFERLLRETRGIRILQNTGDGYFAEGDSVAEVVKFALLFQDAMRQGPWEEVGLTTRLGIHAGEIAALADEVRGAVVAPAADLASRVMSLAVGGQILLTRFPFDEARHFLREHPPLCEGAAPPLCWLAHGPYRMKGRDEALEIFEVGAEGLAPLTPPPDGEKAKRAIRPGEEETLGWRPAIGLEIPGRLGWKLTGKLGAGGFGEVWVGEQAKLARRSAFKFCFDDQRLRALKREVVLVRLLRTALGERDDIVRLHELKLDEPPFYLESDLAPHGNLLQWAEKRGGLEKIPLAQRIALVAYTASALAAAHGVGVLHKDIKPTNILIFDGPGGEPRPRLVDFGIGSLADPSVLNELKMTTVSGFTGPTGQLSTGTPTYCPPEYVAGKPYTIQGDIYGLGVLLYQLATARALDPIAPGWERDIPDALLREDIATCVDGDPARRFSSATELAERLCALPGRRRALEEEEERRRLEEQLRHVQETERKLAEETARRQEAERLRLHAETKEKEAAEANARLTKLLEMASMADYAVAIQRIEKDGKWHEGVAHLVRALDWAPANRFAAARLWSTVAHHVAEKRNWPCQTVRFEHKALALSFTEAGAMVITGGAQRLGEIWDIGRGQRVGKPLQHQKTIRQAMFSAGGTLALTISGEAEVCCWSVATGELVSSLGRIGGPVMTAQFSPDGSRVLCLTENGIVRTWDTATGRILVNIGVSCHSGAIYEVNFSPDGLKVVTASADQTARIFDACSGVQVGNPLRHEIGICKAAFSPDGSTIVTRGLHNHTVQCWDIGTGQQVGKEMPHAHVDFAVAFNCEGSKVAMASRDRMGQIWSTATGEPLGEPLWHQSRLLSIAFSPAGEMVATASKDCTVRLWESATGRPLGEALLHEGPASGAVFSPDGLQLLSIGSDHMAYLWDIPRPAFSGEPLRHGRRSVWRATFCSDDSTILTANKDGSVQRWDSASVTVIGAPFQSERSEIDPEFSRDGTKMLQTSFGTFAQVWDIRTGMPVGGKLAHANVVALARFSDDGSLLVTTGGGRAGQIWEVATGQPFGPHLVHRDRILSAAFSPDVRKLITGSRDGIAGIWDVRSSKPPCEPLEHGAPVWKVAFSRDGSKVITLGRNNGLRIWSADTGQPLSEHLFADRALVDADFNTDASRIVAVSADGSATLWDASGENSCGRILQQKSKVRAAAFSPVGTTIVTTDDIGIARIYDPETSRQIGEPFGHLQEMLLLSSALPGSEKHIAAEFNSDGTRLLTTGDDNAARIWELRTVLDPLAPVPEWVRRWARAIAGVQFTEDGELVTVNCEGRMKILKAPLEGDDAWTRLAAWVATPPELRTIHPDSKRTFRELAERERDLGSRKSLESSLRYDPAVPLARLMLASFDTSPHAAFLRDYDLARLPDDPALWLRAVRLLHEQKDKACFERALAKLRTLAPQQAQELALELASGAD